MKLVIDANVLISACSREGEARNCWQGSLGSHTLCISPELFAEVERSLRKAEFGFTAEKIRTILLEILDRCEVVRVKNTSAETFDDEKQTHLAALASQINADLIVTDDDGLLEKGRLGDTRVIPISSVHDECDVR